MSGSNKRALERLWRETELIKEIVEEMSSILGLHKQSNMTNIPHLIGRKHDISTVTSFLERHGTGVLTIWGMSGIGKTSLAEYIFKSHHHQFKRSCILLDIERQCERRHGLFDLQKKLLLDIGYVRRQMDIHDSDVNTCKIEDLLWRKRTLLVLDGIDKVEQLDALLGKKGLHFGSKIIITSKNRSLTKNCMLFKAESPPELAMHELKGLVEEQSLELLSWSSFGCNDPKEVDEQESMKRVVYHCQGHPLALTVLGSSIRTEDSTWDDILDSFGKHVKNDIRKVPQTSFDSLPDEKDKQLFKLIACFFVGKDRDHIEKMLIACGICKRSGIKNLINRCLVTGSNPLQMHQLLQDLGRYIVQQESPIEPGERSLLWNHEECLDVLQKCKGTNKVGGLVLDMKRQYGSNCGRCQNFGDDLQDNFRSFPLFEWLFGWISGLCSLSHDRQEGVFETRALSKMHNLRILQLNYVQLNGPYDNFPDSIKWLCMRGFPLSYIPSDLQMKNMVALDMSHSKLKQLWKKQPQVLKSLKFLNLSHCHELVSVGHFSQLPALETLTLEGCTSLVEICESIGKCEKLVLLDMNGCIKIKGLPKSIGKLKSLKTLWFDGGLNLNKFPVEIEVVEASNVNIRSQVAIMEGIWKRPKASLIYLPSSLVELSLTNCNLMTESFPMSFSSLSMLKILYLNENPIVSLPDCLRSLVNLDYLYVVGCRRLKTALCVPSTIGCMNFGRCESLEKITFYPETILHGTLVHETPTEVRNESDGEKVVAIAEVDERILHGLGWIDIQEVKIHYEGEIHPAKMRLRKPISGEFVTVRFQGEELPNWITHRRNGSSISITIPSSSRIRGLNFCMVRKDPDTKLADCGCVRVHNMTNGHGLGMMLMFFASEVNKGIVWLSHWHFDRDFFEDGDEVLVYYESPTKKDTINPMEVGISFVYYDDENKNEGFYEAAYEDPFHYRLPLNLKAQYDSLALEEEQKIDRA